VNESIEPTVVELPSSSGVSGEEFGQLLRDTHRALSKELANRIADFGITLGQWYFLRVLWEGDGLSQRELSSKVGLVEPTTAAAVSRLEKSGLVERRVESQDRRRRLVYLTRDGLALKDKLLPIAQEVNRTAANGFDGSLLERTRRLLKHLKSNLDSDLNV